ncbi:hypothetical protein [Niastella yeongjuensis]|nr:hypothetical protein [Niastella yeongjuensis]
MPGFLKRAEQKLLLNKPLIWSTRVHLVLYYGILYNLLLAGLCFVAPIDLTGYSHAPYWIGFIVIIDIIGLTVWLIYLLRFNVFKKYGNIKPLHALVTFLMYFISVGIIVLSAFVYPAVECIRANVAFGDEELVHDINTMNIRICQLEHKRLNTPWKYDTVAPVKDIKVKADSLPREVDYDTIVAPVEPAVIPAHGSYKLDTATFQDRLVHADSVVKLNDTMYLDYQTPDLLFVSAYRMEDGDTREKLLSSFEIYNRSIRNPPASGENTAIAKELLQLQNKYLNKSNSYYPGYGEEVEPGETTNGLIRKKYHIADISTSVYNIANKKDTFSDTSLGLIIRSFYYFTLVISLLVFIFRHTTVRTFFLSLLTGVLLTIFTVLIESLANGGFEMFIGSMIGYALLFFVGTIFTFSLAKRSKVNGILINLFIFMIPVLPLLVVDLIYELKKEQNYRQHGSYYGAEVEQYFAYAEIGGAVLLLVLLATYLNKVYRRWYSLPEN